MASTEVARRPAEQWIDKLEKLTGRTFQAPDPPLAGDELEHAVDEALDAVYGPAWDRGWEQVAVAVRALYGGAAFPLRLPAFAPGTVTPARASTMRRVVEIREATGCDFDAAVRRAEREEIAAHGAPLRLCNAARAHAETLAELYPGRTFTPVLEPMSSVHAGDRAAVGQRR